MANYRVLRVTIQLGNVLANINCKDHDKLAVS